MADVNIIPRIRCDNCGLVVEKTAQCGCRLNAGIRCAA